ncbi:MAG TPA: hypothetical protein VI636_19815 [Candidatus Angelobacter sp.]
MRKMQRAGAVLVLLTLTATLLSCSRKPTGTYVNTKDSKVTLELKSDGSFTVSQKTMNRSVNGTYKIEGTVITFTLQGHDATGKLQDGVLTDPDGDTWKKL